VKLTATKFLTLLVNYVQNENLLCVCEDLQNNGKNKQGFLNPTIKFQLKRQKFQDIAETKSDTQELSNSFTERDFKRCFQQWEKSCTLCVHPVGNYFEEKNTTYI
jgi:hypothetical protein